MRRATRASPGGIRRVIEPDRVASQLAHQAPRNALGRASLFAEIKHANWSGVGGIEEREKCEKEGGRNFMMGFWVTIQPRAALFSSASFGHILSEIGHCLVAAWLDTRMDRSFSLRARLSVYASPQSSETSSSAASATTRHFIVFSTASQRSPSLPRIGIPDHVRQPAFSRTLRIPRGMEVIGREDFELFPPRLAESFRLDDEEVFRTGQPKRNIVELFFNEQGVPDWYITHKIPLRDDCGKVIGLMGISHSFEGRREVLHRDLQLGSHPGLHP